MDVTTVDQKIRASVQLQPYERHIACFLVALFLGLGIAGFEWREVLYTETPPLVTVKVVGAVESKEIMVPLGSTVEDVLSQVVVCGDADCTEIDRTRKVLAGGVLVVPYRERKTFFVCGAVREPSLVRIEGEVTAKKILGKIDVCENANVSAFLRRRIFSNGSVIEVKTKKKRI